MIARIGARALDRARRVHRPVLVGLGVVALLAFTTAVLLVVLGSGRATAQAGAGPQPYGGQLEKADVDSVVTAEQILEVGMLTVGTVNGLAFAAAAIASRGPSTAQTRRALTERTGAGVVSESRRARRGRTRDRSAPEPAPEVVETGVRSPVVPMAVLPAAETAGGRPGGPRSLPPRTPPPGAVPVQARPRHGVPVRARPQQVGLRQTGPQQSGPRSGGPSQVAAAGSVPRQAGPIQAGPSVHPGARP